MFGVCLFDVFKVIFDLGKLVIYEIDDLFIEVLDGIFNVEFMCCGKVGMEYVICYVNVVVVLI